jgi:hypothetical protein
MGRRGALVFLVAAVAWSFSPGLRFCGAGASAVRKKLAGTVVHEWQPNDSAHGDGPVRVQRPLRRVPLPGRLGGAGTNAHNVLAFEIHPTTRDPRSATVSSTPRPSSRRAGDRGCAQVYPVIKGGTRIVDNCNITFRDFDPVRLERVQTPPLFGLGWVDRMSSKAITAHRVRRSVAIAIKEFQLDFDSIGTGRPHILPDGRVGKFGWKAQFATLKEFVAAACSNELGLGNPLMEQAQPLGKPAPATAKRDLDSSQFGDLVAFGTRCRGQRR